MMKLRSKNHRKIITAFSLLAIMATAPKTVLAAACCQCNGTVNAALSSNWPTTQTQLQNRVTSEYTGLRTFWVQTLWQDNILPAMMGFADQVVAVSSHQTAIIGTFFDAKQQLETQRTLQRIRARAHKDYHPSTGVCTFGSTTRSLAASERKAELTAHVLSQRFQDRMLGGANTAAAPGPAADKMARIRQFREKFCDPTNNNNSLGLLCEHDQDNDLSNSTYRSSSDGIGASDIQRMNKDIDYLRTIDNKWTLDIDFTNTDLTDDEEDVLALADNLYGHEVFLRPPGPDLLASGPNNFPAIAQSFMDARAAVAKLSVAKNSFDSITSMKAKGTAGSRDSLKLILEELGVTDSDDIDQLLGATTGASDGPSYYAQMEVLTKKIYQNPDFYTNLYDKPANVERKRVAMQAIGLMQKYDLYKSYLRYEAALSVLLELAVVDLQERVDIQSADQTRSGE